MNKVKRYLLFLVGLFINALGVSLVTKASLGTSPISSIPYVLSLHFPLTLGNFTIIFSILLIVLQILILRKNFKMENILQIPVSVAFGYFIDFTMYLFAWMNPQNYLVKLISLLAGCIVLGFGVYMEVVADVVMLPGESFVRAIVQTWNTNFGTTKIIFDSSMSVIAGVLSFLFFGKLNGVREGTVIAALLVGFIARLFGKHLEFVKPYLFPEEYAAKKEEPMANSLLYDLFNQMYQSGNEEEEAPKDKIYEAEAEVIRKLAEKGKCVIIGRCSDYILRDNSRVLKVFFTAPIESRIRRVMKRLGVEAKDAQHKIHREDKMRADNYHYYTGRIWGAAANFDLTVNTDLGIEYIENCIERIL